MSQTRERVRIQVGSKVAWDLGALVADLCRDAGMDYRVDAGDSVRDDVIAAGHPLTVRPATRPRRQQAARLVQQWLLVSTFGPAFSSMWARRRERYAPLPVSNALAYAVDRSQVPASSLNRLIGRATGLLFGSDFDGVIIQITPSWMNERLCDRSARTVALVESWDHHCKMPTGYWPDVVVGWNQSLTDAWMQRQGAVEGRSGYPHKLAYAAEASWSRPAPSDVAVYAFTLSSHARGFDEEVVLAGQITGELRRSGASVRLKFKPAESAEVERQVSQQLRVDGWGAVGRGRGDEYRLEPGYNQARVAELRDALFIVCFGTTLALDAAAAGTPVAQLDMRSMTYRYPTLARLAANEHLCELLYPDGAAALRPTSVTELNAMIAGVAAGEDQTARHFTDYCRSWLLPGWTQTEALRNLQDLIAELSGDATAQGRLIGASGKAAQ